VPPPSPSSYSGRRKADREYLPSLFSEGTTQKAASLYIPARGGGEIEREQGKKLFSIISGKESRS